MKTIMATDVVNLFMYHKGTGQVLNTGSSCWVFLLFSLFITGHVNFLYATEIKTSQECLFIEQYLVHFLVLFYVWTYSQHNQKWIKEGLLQCNVPKKNDKGLFVLVYMQCVSPMAICYLIVGVSKCVIKAIARWCWKWMIVENAVFTRHRTCKLEY